MLPVVWLLGELDGTGLGDVGSALSAGGASVQVFAPTRVRAWTAGLEAPPREPPQLIVLTADIGHEADSGLLRWLQARSPWRYMPRTVLATRDDPDLAEAMYDLGVASWVVLPAATDERRAAAELFARYWLGTTLVPNPSLFVNS